MNEEISLRDIINLIWRQKWIIVIITVFCLVISLIYSLFILQPTYQSYSIVRLQSESLDDGKSLTNIKEFQETLQSSSTINSLINKNQLDPNKYSINSIRNMFNLQLVQDSNIMKITVNGSNPLEVSQMANMLAYELGVRIEITDRTRVVVKAQKRLEELNDLISIAKVKHDEVQSQLKNTPEKQITTQSVTDNELIRAIEQEKSNLSIDDSTKLQMKSEVINPVYTELLGKVAQSAVDLKSLEAEGMGLKEKIEANMHRINEIELKSSSDKLDANKSIRILDGTNAIFINPSIKQDTPVGPNKTLNAVIAVVVGFILSLMFVFIRDYLHYTGSMKKT